MQKIKIGHRAKFRDRDNFFSTGFISVSLDFRPYFHFRCVARATFDRNLIYSADACFLVMACVGYSRMQLKTLSSLLNLVVCPFERKGGRRRALWKPGRGRHNLIINPLLGRPTCTGCLC